MTNKIQGIILMAAAVLVVLSERFSQDMAIIFAAVVLVGVAIWEFIEDRRKDSSPFGKLKAQNGSLGDKEPINPEQIK